MKSKIYIIGLLMALFLPNLKAHAQKFILKDKYEGIIDENSGRRFIEIQVFDSIYSIDSYMSSIYTTLSENYPDAKIQLIGNRVIKMDATSEGIHVSEEDLLLQGYLDFSITFEARDHTEHMWTGMDEARREEVPCIRVMAPTVNKLTVYNPYVHPEIKVFRTSKNDIMEFLLSKEPIIGRRTIGEEFLSEVHQYIIHNIRAELNQNYYKEKWPLLAKKNKRSTY